MKSMVFTLIFLPFLASAEMVAPSAAAVCIGCHGNAGISTNSLWPNLAGQKADYLLKQLNDFRQGRRNDALMTPVAQTLSESDLLPLAKYFSSLK